MEQQAQELDADGYSSYLLLANLLQDENRYASVLEGLGHAAHRSAASDELLFTAFFVVVLNVFCAFWRKRTEVAALYELVHPPPPVRINNIIQVAQMFAGQNSPVADTWFQPSRFTELFRTAAATIPGSGRRTWDSQMALLRSPEGERYARRFSRSSRRRERRLNRGRLMAEWDRIGFSHGEGHEPMLVSYVDILGFGELINTKTAGEISRLLRIFNETTAPHKFKNRGPIPDLPDEDQVSFSDLILTCTPLRRRGDQTRFSSSLRASFTRRPF